MTVEAVDLDLLTSAPTRKPTLQAQPLLEEETDNKSNLLIGIIIVSGMIVVLGSFRLFRHGEERAAKKRSEEMDHVQAKKEKARLDELHKAEGKYGAQIGYGEAHTKTSSKGGENDHESSYRPQRHMS
jgi:ABC-type nickel/cobalt efflux system permease component RcnA